ncbi:exonuclease SbcCD subunit D [Buchananella felis]|uniref:exonuclease SbcCD subunit D n=1 Tax=Buchananella felis TaxID=3231492 RepID=UPI0035276FE2
MRILHTSDWHVGRTLHGASLESAHARFFDWLVETVKQEAVDAVIVAGDVFDRAVPPLEAVQLVDRVITALSAHARVVLTPGNHDSALRLGFGQDWNGERVIVRSRVADVGQPVVLPKPDGQAGAVLFALPYLDPELARGQLAHALAGREVARSHEGVVAAAMEMVRAGHARVDQDLPVVLVAHAFVAGGRASDSERDIKVGGVDLVPSEVLVPPQGWQPDYVALGHLHRAQFVAGLDGGDGGSVVRYSGSPVAFSFSEAEDQKSVTIVELDKRGAGVKIRVLSTPVERPLAVLTGQLAELLGPAYAPFREHYVSVEVTDRVRPAELVTRVKAVFPWALSTQHKPVDALSQSQVDLASRRASRAQSNPVDVVGEFIAAVTGRGADAEIVSVIRESYESVRSRKAGTK